MATVFEARPISRDRAATQDSPAVRFARAIRTVRHSLSTLETAADTDPALREALRPHLEAFAEELEALKAAHPSAFSADDWLNAAYG